MSGCRTFQKGAACFGDLVLAAFFEGENPKTREQKRSEYAAEVVNSQIEKHRSRLEEWRHAEQPLAPFHWESSSQKYSSAKTQASMPLS